MRRGKKEKNVHEDETDLAMAEGYDFVDVTPEKKKKKKKRWPF